MHRGAQAARCSDLDRSSSPPRVPPPPSWSHLSGLHAEQSNATARFLNSFPRRWILPVPSQPLVPRQAHPTKDRQVVEQPSLVRYRRFSSSHLGIKRTRPLHTHMCTLATASQGRKWDPILSARPPAMCSYRGNGAGPRPVSDGRIRRQCYGRVLGCMSHRRPPYNTRSRPTYARLGARAEEGWHGLSLWVARRGGACIHTRPQALCCHLFTDNNSSS